VASATKTIMDNIFDISPLFARAEEEDDPFRDWVLEVRADAGIDDGVPRKASFRGGALDGLAEIVANPGQGWGYVGRTYKVLGPEGLDPGDFDPE
jgi:hypothetical protein